MTRFVAIAGLVLGMSAFSASSCQAQAATPALQDPQRERSVREIISSSSRAVVLIVTYDASEKPLSLGSGFMISPDGTVVTNYHVIKGAKSAVVKLSNGAFFPVEGTLATSEDDDLALVKVSGTGLPFLRLGDIGKLAVGDRVIAIGSPLGLEGTVSDGIVSAIREGVSSATKWIQTTAPASHGNSGGPLLNIEGKVVGVLTWKREGGENLNFAVGADSLQKLFASAPTVPLPLRSVSHSEVPAVAPTPEASRPETNAGRVPPLQSGVFVVAYRTPRHQTYSTPEVFQGVVDELLLFLKSHHVLLYNDAIGRAIETEARPSIYELLSYAKKARANSLLFLTVDRPINSWVKVTLQCFDMAGTPLWEETTSDSGWLHTGGAGVRNAVQKMEAQLGPRLGRRVCPSRKPVNENLPQI